MTEVTLKEHIESRITALEKATVVAANAMEKRLDGMNEIRGQLKDQSTTFLTRSEYALAHERLIADIRQLRELAAELRGKANQSQVNITTMIAVAGLILAALSILEKVLIK